MVSHFGDKTNSRSATGARSPYGFITPEGGGKDVFYHAADFTSGDKYPQTGDNVTYDVVDDERKPGSKKAINVRGGSGAVYLSPEEYQAGNAKVAASS